ncbi:hypothetical protein TYRP_001559, partial [Tyrophagus putrescentiae]
MFLPLSEADFSVDFILLKVEFLVRFKVELLKEVLISRRRTRRTALVATVEEVGGGGQRQRNDDGRPLDHLAFAL